MRSWLSMEGSWQMRLWLKDRPQWLKPGTVEGCVTHYNNTTTNPFKSIDLVWTNELKQYRSLEIDCKCTFMACKKPPRTPEQPDSNAKNNLIIFDFIRLLMCLFLCAWAGLDWLGVSSVPTQGIWRWSVCIFILPHNTVYDPSIKSHYCSKSSIPIVSYWYIIDPVARPDTLQHTLVKYGGPHEEMCELNK